MSLQTVYTVRDGLDGSVQFAHCSLAECKQWITDYNRKYDMDMGHIIDIWEFGKVIGTVQLDFLDPLDFANDAKIWKTRLFEEVKA